MNKKMYFSAFFINHGHYHNWIALQGRFGIWIRDKVSIYMLNWKRTLVDGTDFKTSFILCKCILYIDIMQLVSVLQLL